LKQLVHSPLVCFRGTRTYVHSTTLYEQLIQGTRNVGLQICGPVDMRVSQLIRKQPQFLFKQGLALRDCGEHAMISFHVGEAPWHCLISERDEWVTQREVYDEAAIREKAVVEGQTIRVDGRVDAKPFEIVTSLTLQLHNALLSIPADRKWFLGRIQLERPLLEEDAEKMQIILTKKSGERLTRCVIASGPISIGTVDFMLGNLA
jgi:hypothetical protein